MTERNDFTALPARHTIECIALAADGAYDKTAPLRIFDELVKDNHIVDGELRNILYYLNVEVYKLLALHETAEAIDLQIPAQFKPLFAQVVRLALYCDGKRGERITQKRGISASYLGYAAAQQERAGAGS